MEKKFFYYRIFDDQEEKNYIRTSLTHDQITNLVEKYKSDRQKYLNDDFMEFLQKEDPNAETFEITRIYY